MMQLLKDIVADKAAARIVIRSFFTQDRMLKFQAASRTLGLSGVCRVNQYYAQLDVEGPRSRIDRAIANLRSLPIFTQPAVLDVSWVPYRNQYDGFRTTL